MHDNELHEYTRGRWKLNPERAKNAKYGLAVYNGVVQEVYEILEWHKAGATSSIRLEKENIGLDTVEV